MHMIELLQKIMILCGIPAILGAFIYIGRKLQVLDELKQTNEKIKFNLKVVSDTLVSCDVVAFDHTILQSYSPLNLTEKGLQLIEEVGFAKVFSEHKVDFFQMISIDSPQSAYDVELASMKSIISLFDKEYFAPVKAYMYNNPEKNNLRQMAYYLGVYVRDAYFNEYPQYLETNHISKI